MKMNNGTPNPTDRPMIIPMLLLLLLLLLLKVELDEDGVGVTMVTGANVVRWEVLQTSWLEVEVELLVMPVVFQPVVVVS